MRCDLHVHTIYCEKLKRFGMDLVTITGHDSIDAAESLRKHPDFFLSKEATCHMPSGREVHIGIYDITERQYIEIQRRRNCFYSLLGYLNEQKLLFSINHLLSSLTGPRDQSELAAHMGKAPIGGSDAHTIAPGARNKDEFLHAVRAGQGIVQGESGSFSKLTRDVWTICGGMMKESRWTRALAPLLAAVPAVILVNCLVEASFAERWFGRIVSLRKNGAFASWDIGKVSA